MKAGSVLVVSALAATTSILLSLPAGAVCWVWEPCAGSYDNGDYNTGEQTPAEPSLPELPPGRLPPNSTASSSAPDTAETAGQRRHERPTAKAASAPMKPRAIPATGVPPAKPKVARPQQQAAPAPANSPPAPTPVTGSPQAAPQANPAQGQAASTQGQPAPARPDQAKALPVPTYQVPLPAPNTAPVPIAQQTPATSSPAYVPPAPVMMPTVPGTATMHVIPE